MNARIWLLVLLAVVLSSGCRKRKSELSSEEEAPASKIALLTQQKHDVNPVDSILMSEVVQANKTQLPKIANLLESRLAEFTDNREHKYSTELRDVLVKTAANDTNLLAALKKRAKLVDQFPVIPFEAIPRLQNLIFSITAKKHQEADEAVLDAGGQTDFVFAFDSKEVSGKQVACQIPAPAFQPVKKFESLGIYSGSTPLDGPTIYQCFHDNSASFSKVLNILSLNHRAVAERSKRTINLHMNKDGKRVSASVSDFKGMLNFFEKQGLSLEVFSTRFIVDFLGLYYKDTSEAAARYRPIRMPVWFSGVYNANRDRLTVPGEHSEIGVMIHDGTDRRLAQVRYFLGVPSAEAPGLNSYWRPHTDKAAKWHSLYREFVDVYDEDLFKAAPWFESVALVRRELQSIQGAFRLPLNAYGFFVCSDSVAIVTAVMKQRRESEGKAFDFRAQAFPLVRVDVANYIGTEFKIEFSKIINDGLNLPENYLDRVYPQDFTLDPASLVQRVKAAYTAEDRMREVPPTLFDDFYKEMEKIRGN